ncbi:MAG: hypothetical protein ACHQ1G_09735 [Planctomycetota bacterium]
MRRLLLLAFLLAAPAARAAPEASPELAALVPAETLFLVECNDLDGAGRFGSDTAIGKLLAEPEVQQFAKKLGDSFRSAFTGNTRGPLAMVGLTPEDFDGIRFRRVGFALVNLSIEAEQADAVLCLETRAGGEKVARILQALRQAGEAFAGIQFTEAEVRGRKVLSTAFQGHEFCLAVQGDRFLLTTRAARMDDVLKSIDEGRAASLRDAPRVTRLKERMGVRKSAIFGYVDAAAAGKLVVDAIAEELPRARGVCASLGLDAVEAIGFADMPEGAGYRTEAAVLLKERRGLFALAPKTPTSHRFAKMTPADALCYGGETSDLVALWDGVLELVGAIDAGTRTKLEQGELEAGAFLGLDIRKDLLAALGTEWAGYVAWPQAGGLIPDLVMFASVRDRERLARSLDALAAKAGEMVRGDGASVTERKTEFRGREIRFLEVTDRRGEPRPYAPAWAFGEDFVVLALCPQSVKHALMEKAALADSADFKRLLAAAPRTAVSTTYLDLGRILAWGYATAVPVLQVVQGAIHRTVVDQPVLAHAMAGIRLNFEDLPPVEVIARHLSGMVTYTAVEDDCFRLGFVSDVGAPLAIAPVAFVAGLVVVLLPMGPARRAEIERVQAERQAQAIREARRLAEAAQGATDAEQLRAENAMLRERLAKLEQQVQELLRAAEQEEK